MFTDKFCDLRQNPIITNKNNWLFQYKGRISVGKKIYEDPSEISIIAYSDNIKDATILRRIAKDEDGIIIKNYMEEGVSTIDANEYNCEI